MDYKLLNLKVLGDERGKLISLEGGKNIPFEIKRVYWIYDTLPDIDRGFHAHKDLEQVIVAMDGACEFVLDDGKTRKEVWLNRPDVGLYIGKNMWREMRHFSYGCKLMVLASEYYDEKEYIRDYKAFLENVKTQNGFKLLDIGGGGKSLKSGLICPFEIKRIFYIFDTKGDIVRGCHANKDSEFLMFCLQGSCRVRVDNGKIQSEVALTNLNTALYLEKMVWKEMFDFSNDAVFVVLTNTLYNEKEYVRDYGEFLRTRNNAIGELQ